MSAIALGTGGVLAVPAVAQAAVSADAQVVISEVYGGGGNSGATLKNDFVELYNKGATPVDLSTWSVQYASANATTWANTPSGRTNLTGSIAPGAYYLIQEAAGAGGTTNLPTPDATGSLALGATSFKIALVNNQVALSCGGDCDGAAAVIDFVGAGSTNDFTGSASAPAPSNTTSVARNAAVVNTADNAADFLAGTPTPKAATGAVVPPVDPPAAVAKTIQEIQGTGPASTLVGTNVTTDGVVTAAYPTGGFNGYVIQTPGTGGAIDFATHTGSDAVFVFSAATVGSAAIGQHVEVTGIVGEYAGQTQVNVAAGGLTVLNDTVAAPTPATATLPTTDAQRETLEGMLYAPSGSYTITNNFSTNNYGELGLATGTKPLIQPTEIAKPKTAEYDAAVADNAARGIVLDDGASTNFLSAADSSKVPPYLAAADDPTAIAPRVGAAVTFTQPVIFSQGGSTSAPSYRFQPRGQAVGGNAATYPATWTNTRTNAPDAAKIGDADVKVASFNVLNFFTKLGVDVVPTCTSYKDRAGNPITVNTCPGNGPRGAWDTASFNRQRAKIVDAIVGSGANVAGLMEIENSAVLGEAKDATVSALVDALNAKTAAGTWAFVPSSTDLPPTSEMDVINNAIIYQPAKVTPVGASRALGTQSAAGQAFDNAREPIAQKFLPVGTDTDPFLLVVNHFKSKGSGSGDDADQGDGQGASNASRVKQATALNTWIDSINTADDAVISVGDYNSYSQEDPLQVLYTAGYSDAEHVYGLNKYSYSFSGRSGSLDHALLNAKMQARTTGADIWNINSAESVTAEYSRYNYHGALYYQDNPFGASDHDPVVVGIKAKNASVTSKITLLNINDFHGRIDSNTVKFAGTIEQLRAAGGEDNTVLLSAGDNVGASVYASSFEKDKPTIDVLNALDLKASAVGNHEFDGGFDDLKNRITQPYDATTNPLGGANWKYLGANVYLKGTTTPALPEYQIVTVGGLQVGVIGAVTQETPTLVSPAGVADLDFGDPVVAVNRVAAQLTDGNPANGEADVLVAEYHEGAGSGTPEGATIEQEIAAGGAFAEIVTQTSPKVAAIFTGHTHKQYAWEGPVPGVPGATRPILQTGSYGEFIGEITLTVTDGVVTAHTVRDVKRATAADNTLAASYPRVAEVQRITNAAIARSAVAGNVPVGSVAADITTAFTGGSYGGTGDTYVGGTRDDRANESTLGDLVADSLVEQLRAPQYGSAEIGVVNPGGLRADLLQAPDGVITTSEAVSVLPFANNLNTITLTGAQFKTLLEQQWQLDAAGNVPTRAYLQLGLSKNVTYTYDAAAPQGSHITSITVNGKPYSLTANYRIGTFSFLIAGGDNFRAFLGGTNNQDSGLVDRDAFISFLQANPGLTPDFARQAVSLPQVPSTVEAGQELSFTVGGLNLTSLGSPKNTSVDVKLDAVTLGSTPVSSTTLPGGGLPDTRLVGNGSAAVRATVPAGTTAGVHTVTVTAVPSGTTVTFPVTVTAVPPVVLATTTTLTATSAVQVYQPTNLQTLTATVATSSRAPGVGIVRFKRDGVVFGTVRLDSTGVARIRVPADLLPGATSFTAEFTPTTEAQSASVSAALAFRVALVTTTVAVSARGVTLSAADQKKFKVVSGLIVTSTVKGTGSTYVPAGKVHVNIRGTVTTVTLSGGRGVTPVIPTAKGTVTIYSTYEPTGTPVVATRSLGRVTASVRR
ncbi:ExeM/NucH family extracellular endonuclease [Nakamurella sp. A5-74]|uniref:ExeM/NucH family extracellular endonuclease n=1 Tax=Nakamurella sp. A5-74 TaxID=3158264 RepID=A0AAU8DN78_9ACTN